MMSAMMMAFMRMTFAGFSFAGLSSGFQGHFAVHQFFHQFFSSAAAHRVDGAMPSAAGAIWQGFFDAVHFHVPILSFFQVPVAAHHIICLGGSQGKFISILLWTVSKL